MTIQNLYKIKISQNKESKKTKRLLLYFFTFFLLGIGPELFSQENIIVPEDLKEEEKIEFQTHFFDAITNKAINNYEKAIESLEKCDRIQENNVAVLFELSKNYAKLDRGEEAIMFAKKALHIAPKNLWILEHQVFVLRKNNAIDEAIEVQQDIIKYYPEKKPRLVYLYLQKNDIATARNLLQELEDAKSLTPRLRNIKKQLNKREASFEIKDLKKNTTANTSIENLFNTYKSYEYLEELLLKLDTENDPKLGAYSEQGLALFPAQPLVYLMHGRALNKSSQFKEAIQVLQGGIDFVIDNDALERSFYIELLKGYEGTGNEDKAKIYRAKLKR